jgi:hypothetical protein
MRSLTYTLKKFFSLSVNRPPHWGMFACLFSATRQTLLSENCADVPSAA